MNTYFKRLATLISASLATDVGAEMMADTEVPVAKEDVPSASVLNTTVSIRLAAHRSHSSHSSHSSHRSSSGARPRTAPPPPPSRSAPKSPVSPESDPLGQEPRPKTSYPPEIDAEDELTKKLNDEEARKYIIMRMQLFLQFEEIYEGPIDGVMGPETRKAVLEFKKQKGIPGDTVLDVETLNAFGIQGY